jgi:hypothetical protein
VHGLLPWPAFLHKKGGFMKNLGIPVHTAKMTWVQTDRKAHEAWAKLVLEKPKAAALLHFMVANMGAQNALVISQDLIAKMLDCSLSTDKRAVSELQKRSWIQVVDMGKGTTKAYVVNAAVAWAQKREQLHTAVFAATVVADLDDQTEPLEQLTKKSLKRIPTLYPGEQQLPAGDGLDPPSEQYLDGLTPDLPFLEAPMMPSR